MKKRIPQLQPIVELARGEVESLHAATYTLHEAEALALAWHLLGGLDSISPVFIRHDRSGFKRTGTGLLPRAWLRPFETPVEDPLPIYHPKLVLAKQRDGSPAYRLLVSTANLSTADQRVSRNLATALSLSRDLGEQTANWIRKPRANQRVFNVLARAGKVKLLRGAGPTFKQFLEVVQSLGCGGCGRRDRDLWLIAAPFWNPIAFASVFAEHPHAHVEAYFRDRPQWDRVGASLSRDRLGQIERFTLRSSHREPPWHHKLVAWRCCTSSRAGCAAYLGSANATGQGFFGINGKVVNWEVGVIAVGGKSLWDHARGAARCGLTAVRLGVPRGDGKAENDEEVGAHGDDEHILRALRCHLAASVIIYRASRDARLRSGIRDRMRAGCEWWNRERVMVIDGERRRELCPGRALTMREGVTVALEGRYESEKGHYLDISFDIAELGPEPKIPEPTPAGAIASALAGLLGTGRDGSGGNDTTGEPVPTRHAPADIRFPFSEFFDAREARPAVAEAWLSRFGRATDATFAKLPSHWQEIARELARRWP